MATAQALRQRRGRLRARETLIAVAALLFSACGLAVNDEERYARAEAEFAEGNYRLAAIELKNLLRNSPDVARARLLLARSSVELGDYAAAEKEFRRARELGIDTPALALGLVESLIELGRLEEAEAELEAMAGENPQVVLLRGRVALARGDLERAAALFETAATGATRANALLGQAQVQAARGEAGTARRTLDAAVIADPGLARGWLLKGRLEFAAGDYLAAEASLAKAYAEALEASDGRAAVMALSHLSDAQLAQRDLEAARETLGQLRRLAADHPLTKLAAAKIAAVEQDWETAQLAVQEALRVVPEDPRLLSLAGAINISAGNFGQAEMYLNRAVRLAPDDARPRRLLAQAKIQQADPEAAIDILVSGGQASSDDSRSQGLLAAAQMSAGDTEAGIAAMRQALALEPGNAALRAEVVQALVRLGRTEEALTLLRATSDAAGSPAEDALLRLVALQAGDEETAAAEAERLLADYPQDPEVLNVVALYHAAKGRAEEARRHFEAALSLDGENIGALVNLASLDFRQQQWGDARSRLTQALALDRDNLMVMIGLAQVAAATGDARAAGDWLRQAYERDPQNALAGVLYGRWLRHAGNPGLAVTVLENVRDNAPEEASLLRELGLARLEAGQWEAAEADLRRVLELRPDAPEVQVELGRALAGQGSWDAAYESFSAAADAAPDLFPARAGMVSARLAADDAGAALELARALPQDFPEQRAALSLLAQAELRAGDPAAAIETLERAQRMEADSRTALTIHAIKRRENHPAADVVLRRWLAERPEDHHVRFALAQHYQESGQSGAAIEEYEELERLAGGNPVVLNNLAWLYFEAGDERALALARRAHERAPDNSAIADTYGWILGNSGDAEAGLALVAQAYENADGNREIGYHLAALQSAAGRHEAAIGTLEGVLAGNESFASREQAEALLESLRSRGQ